jgi:hypothetical protein
VLLSVWAFEFGLGEPHLRIELHSSADEGHYVFVAGHAIKTQREGDAVTFVFRGKRCVADKQPFIGWALNVDGVLAPRLPTSADSSPPPSVTAAPVEVRYAPKQAIAIGLFALAILVPTTKGCMWARPPTWSSTWRAIDAGEGKMTATMPTDPSFAERPFGPTGQGALLHTYVSEVQDAGIFTVGWARSPSLGNYVAATRSTNTCSRYTTWAIDELLFAIHNGAAQNTSSHSATLITGGIDCTASGTADHDWELRDVVRAKSVRSGPVAYSVRVHIVGDQVFVITSVVAQAFSTSPDIQTFHASVKLTDE